MSDVVDRIDALLPQTQCTRCGYPGCRPYADAMAKGEADINQCPPGGESGIRALAALLGRETKPLNPANGVEKPRHAALIDEARCIGCTLCIQACPVDAIVGAPQQMHTVVTTLCSGCDLCVAPCPVDCIDMVQATGVDATWDRTRADAARERFERRNLRLERERGERAERLALRALKARRSDPEAQKKRAVIQAAIESARAKRAAVTPRNTDNLTTEVRAQIVDVDARRARQTLDDAKK
ncbi:MAG: electron transport complex subunit RsxB [Burkholderiales bacterium]